jgi:hypothetical protein
MHVTLPLITAFYAGLNGSLAPCHAIRIRGNIAGPSIGRVAGQTAAWLAPAHASLHAFDPFCVGGRAVAG